MKRIWLKLTAAWIFLGAYIGASATILIESAIDGEGSTKQSDAITSQVQDAIDKNYDKNAIKEISDFQVSFDQDIASRPFFPGDVLSYSISYQPIDTTYKNLIWTIEDESVLTVNESQQTILFKAPGTSSITIQSERNEKLAKSFAFTCRKIPVSEIRIKKETVELNVGDVYTLEPVVLPENATFKDVAFASTDSAVIEVDSESGAVKAVNDGTAEAIITSIDDPGISAKVPFKVNMVESPDFSIDSISVSGNLGYLNYNKPSLTVKASYTHRAAPFDPAKVHVAFFGDDGMLTFSGVKKIAYGSFQFNVSLKNKELVMADSFSEKNVSFDLTYGECGASSSLKIVPLMKLAIADLDASAIQPLTFRHIFLEKLSNEFNEPLSISVPLKPGLVADQYDKTRFDFELLDAEGNAYPSGYFGSPSRSYLSFTAPYAASSLPVEGKVIYYPDKNDRSSFLTFPFHYEEIRDVESTITGLRFKRLSKERATEFLIGKSYTNADLSGLFATEVVVTSNNAKVKNSLQKAPLTITAGDDDGVSIVKSSSGQITSLTFEEEKETTLTLSTPLAPLTETFAIKGVSKPNEFTFLVDGEPFDGSSLTIGKDQDKTFDIAAAFSTNLVGGDNVVTPVEIDLSWVLPANLKDSLAVAEGAFAVKGIRQSEDGDPVKIVFQASKGGVLVFEKEIEINVDYVPVRASEFALSFSLSLVPNEFNKPNENCSIVPVGSVIGGKIEMNKDATNQKVLFSSSAPSIVSVDAKTGLCEALAPGKAIIRAVSQDDLSISDSKTIEVVETVAPFTLDLEKMKLASNAEVKSDEKGNPTSYLINLEFGSAYSIFIHTDVPCSSSNLNFSYGPSSSDSHSVRVDKAGNLMTIGVGDDVIRISYSNGLQTYFRDVTFRVRKNYRFTWSQLTLIVRKSLGHFSLFAVTALCSIAFIFLFFRKPLWKILALLTSGVLGFSLAGFSELIQLYTPGRSCKWSDVGIDTAGYMLSICLALLIYGIVLLVLFFKNRKKEKGAKEGK